MTVQLCYPYELRHNTHTKLSMSSSPVATTVAASTPALTRYAWLSIAAAIATLLLKSVAWLLTGSVGLLSDALESLVNLTAAVMALSMLHVAAQPPDELHAYGHDKAEYFSSALEGLLILLAAAAIAWSALPRLLHPQPLEALGWGLGISLVASAINFVVARILLQAGRQHRSITLEADGQHLMTDVWTSAGVLAGIAVVGLSGWQRLDPLIALLMAASIARTGLDLLSRSANGLMDSAVSTSDLQTIRATLEHYCQQGIRYQELRTRQAGARCFISVHILVPGEWTVQRGHDLLDSIEQALTSSIPGAQIFTHLEPLPETLAAQPQPD